MEGKQCTGCSKTKPLTEFGVRKDRSKRTPGVLKPLARCKDCMKKVHLIHNTVNKEARRRAGIKYMYDITYEDYEKMEKNQLGLCAICKTQPNGRLYIDHDHTTNKVRGLLCQKCNSGLGMFKDNIQNLLNAINYLEQ